MLPVAKGDHLFNSGGDQEWEIERAKDTEFAIYGMCVKQEQTNRR
jgi:hypothetical protein